MLSVGLSMVGGDECLWLMPREAHGRGFSGLLLRRLIGDDRPTSKVQLTAETSSAIGGSVEK